MKKNTWAKVFAIIALLGIIIGIIGTSILFIFETNIAPSNEIQLSEEQIQELIQIQQESASWSTDSSASWSVDQEVELDWE